MPHSAANAAPLAAEANERRSKVLFLDIGLVSTALGLSILDLEAGDLVKAGEGRLCEQLVGQHLLYSAPSWEEPRLHHWAREKRGSSAEVDYVISQAGEVIPIEVKAGKTGTLKSLHLFLREKHRRLGLRICSQLPSVMDATTSLATGEEVPFTLLTLPLYMVGEIRRLCRQAL